MFNFLLIAAFCTVLPSIQAIPVSDKLIESPKDALPDLPHGLQEAIVAKMPLKERARMSALNKNFKHLGTLECIIDGLHAENGKDAINAAFGMGIDNVEVYDQLLTTLGPHDGNHDKAAQISGRRDNTQKLDEWTLKFHRLPESALVGAAESGDFETFRNASRQRPGWPALQLAVKAAAAEGRTEFLRNVRQEFCNASYLRQLLTVAIDIAAANGHWQTVDDILTAYPKNDAGADHRFAEPVKYAARKGDMARLQKYLNMGTIYPSMTEHAYKAAAAGGHMEILRFLDGCEVKPSAKHALAEAVEHDHREAFDYIRGAHANDGRMFGYALAAAIRHDRPLYAQELAPLIGGQHEIELAAQAAAKRGDIELFNQFLNRSQYRDALAHSGFVQALQSGHWELMGEWARRYPLTETSARNALEIAAQTGRVDAVSKIIKTGLNGVMPNSVMFALDDRVHPTLATAKARLLILAKHPGRRNQFIGSLTPATKLVYADALSNAISLSREEEFTADEIVFLEDLEREFQQ